MIMEKEGAVFLPFSPSPSRTNCLSRGSADAGSERHSSPADSVSLANFKKFGIVVHAFWRLFT